MALKILGIGGPPASGKTTLITRLIERLGKCYGVQKEGLLVYHYFPETKVYLIGRYDGSLFAGTDRLSMAAMPIFKEWVLMLSRLAPDSKIIFEGDRLFSASCIEHLKKLTPDTLFLSLVVTSGERSKRKATRSDGQGAAFIKSRETKYENILSLGLSQPRSNESFIAQEALLAEIIGFLGL